MSKMGREAYDREHKCKSGVKDICEGETERVNEHGVRQCEPCAAHLADRKIRNHLWNPHENRVPWRFLPNKKHKPDVAKSVDWAEVDQRIEDDLKYARRVDEKRTPYNCNETRAEERRKLQVRVYDYLVNDGDALIYLDGLLSHVPDEVLVDCLPINEHTDWDYLLSRGEHQPCLKDSRYSFAQFHPPYKTHAEVVAECDCPKCVADGEE
tara:strand:+ start:54 stop:683 length:630 start_codon:yes stop_codon:yes gene_type:complete